MNDLLSLTFCLLLWVFVCFEDFFFVLKLDFVLLDLIAYGQNLNTIL